MRWVVLLLIGTLRLYQKAVSPWLGHHCRFWPSCSEYAIGAIRKYGPAKGVRLSVLRVARCHPWHPGGIDPVP